MILKRRLPVATGDRLSFIDVVRACRATAAMRRMGVGVPSRWPLAAYPNVMMPLPSRVVRSHARAALATLAAATMLCAALAAGVAPPASPAPASSPASKLLRVYLLAH